MAAAAQPSGRTSREQPATPERILVVDDETAIVQVAVEALRAGGYEPVGVYSPPDALALANQPFDVLVTDFRMPGIDGVELFRALRESNPRLVGVLCTGFGNLGLVRSAMRCGFAAILLKPFRLDRLTDAVHRAIRQRRLTEENHRLGAILDVYAAGQQLGGLRQRDDLAVRLAELAREQFEADGAEVLLPAGDQTELTLRLGPDGQPPLAVGEELAGLEPADASDWLAEAGADTLAAQFLEFNQCTEGLLLVERATPFTPAEFERLALLARQAAAGLAHVRLFEQRLRNEKLALVGRLAGAICERVQEPVQRIRGLAEKLEVDEPDYRDMILDNTSRLETMCGELSDFVTGEESLSRQTIDLGELLRGLARFSEAEFRQAGIAITVAERCAVSLEADPRKLSRAIQNLLKNAAEAMPQGGSIDVVLDRGLATALIEISDTGIGMSPEVSAHLFEPFFSHGKVGGTGLGGAVVRTAVQAHGGRVEVRSEPGVGSTFRLHLPL